MKENTNSEPNLSETSSHSILLISTEIQQIIFNYIFISSIKFVKKNLLNKEPQIKCLYVRQLDKRSPSLSPTLSLVRIPIECLIMCQIERSNMNISINKATQKPLCP